MRTSHLLGHVLSFFRPKNKSIFGVHDPLGLRYLFQLRVSLSPSRSHKGRHNFVDTPSDICHCDQGVENTYHFLFICPTYVTQRATLVTGINEILKNNLNHLENQSQLYLYGHDSISYADNSNIRISTLKYINLRVSSLIGSVGCGWVGACVDMLPLFFYLVFYHSCAICMYVLY